MVVVEISTSTKWKEYIWWVGLLYQSQHQRINQPVPAEDLTFPSPMVSSKEMLQRPQTTETSADAKEWLVKIVLHWDISSHIRRQCLPTLSIPSYTFCFVPLTYLRLDAYCWQRRLWVWSVTLLPVASTYQAVVHISTSSLGIGCAGEPKETFPTITIHQ